MATHLHFPHLHLPHPHLHVPHVLRDHGDGHPGHLTAAALAVTAAVTVGVGAHLTLDGGDAADGTDAGLGSGEAAALVVRPTVDGARTGDAAGRPAVSSVITPPAGTAVTSVALLAADGSQVALTVPADGVVRFDGLAPGAYSLLAQAETPVETAPGGVEISAATVLVHGPVVLDAAGSLVVAVG